MKNKLYVFLSGILIGTCMILPGVSGSVVAILLGIYQWVIILIGNKNITNFYKIKNLLPLVVGILIGIFLFGKILLIFYNNYSFSMMYIFIGLILGSIPCLNNDINKKNQTINLKYVFITFVISTLIFLLPKIFNIRIVNKLNPINLFIGGLLYIAGKVIPGISSSFFLMILGIYDYVLNIITNPLNINFKMLTSLLPFFLGVIIGLFIFIKLITYCINKNLSKTYSSIIGFILGSIIAIFPGIKFDMTGLLSIILMISSYILVNKLTKK